MDDITDEEVDAEIERIRGTPNSSARRKLSKTNMKNVNVVQSLKQLSQDLDYLGVSSLMETLETTSSGRVVVTSLIYSTKDLIYLYKNLFQEHQDSKEKNVLLQKDCQVLQRVIDKQKLELERQEQQIKDYKLELKRSKMETSQLEKKCDNLHHENQLQRNRNISMENAFKHKILKASIVKDQLQSTIRKNCDKYVSQDEALAKQLEEYKSNEEQYKDVIGKLQQQNELLLDEILNLKDDIVTHIYDKQNK